MAPGESGRAGDKAVLSHGVDFVHICLNLAGRKWRRTSQQIPPAPSFVLDLETWCLNKTLLKQAQAGQSNEDEVPFSKTLGHVCL